MGQKVHPIGFRLGIHKDWKSRWFDEKNYKDILHEDLAIRKYIMEEYKDCYISRVEIERWTNEITVIIHTARPGVLIGRGGQRVEELRAKLMEMTGKKVRVDIRDIPNPELDAYLVARNIAEQIERRVSHKRAMKRAVQRAMEAGAKGIKITVSGRLGGAEIARTEKEIAGSVPLHTIRADIDYGFYEAIIPQGVIGVKVWIYKGDVPLGRRHASAEASEV